jgi:hypothetical protein
VGLGQGKKWASSAPLACVFSSSLFSISIEDWACLLFELGRMPVRCYGRINLDFDMQIKKIMF